MPGFRNLCFQPNAVSFTRNSVGELSDDQHAGRRSGWLNIEKLETTPLLRKTLKSVSATFLHSVVSRIASPFQGESDYARSVFWVRRFDREDQSGLCTPSRLSVDSRTQDWAPAVFVPMHWQPFSKIAGLLRRRAIILRSLKNSHARFICPRDSVLKDSEIVKPSTTAVRHIMTSVVDWPIMPNLLAEKTHRRFVSMTTYLGCALRSDQRRRLLDENEWHVDILMRQSQANSPNRRASGGMSKNHARQFRIENSRRRPKHQRSENKCLWKCTSSRGLPGCSLGGWLRSFDTKTDAREHPTRRNWKPWPAFLVDAVSRQPGSGYDAVIGVDTSVSPLPHLCVSAERAADLWSLKIMFLNQFCRRENGVANGSNARCIQLGRRVGIQRYERQASLCRSKTGPPMSDPPDPHYLADTSRGSGHRILIASSGSIFPLVFILHAGSIWKDAIEPIGPRPPRRRCPTIAVSIFTATTPIDLQNALLP